MYRSSTIQPKYGYCQHPGCKTYGPLTKKLCGIHYWSSVRLKSVEKQEQKILQLNRGLSDTMFDLDEVFSQWIRLKSSDENGYCRCFGCSKSYYWTETECCHYIPRIHKNTRFLEENCVCGCRSCNKNEGGLLSSYSSHFGNLLEKNRAGSVEALEQQARVEYNYDVPELKSLISYYSKEVRRMKKLKPMKL